MVHWRAVTLGGRTGVLRWLDWKGWSVSGRSVGVGGVSAEAFTLGRSNVNASRMECHRGQSRWILSGTFGWDGVISREGHHGHSRWVARGVVGVFRCHYFSRANIEREDLAF